MIRDNLFSDGLISREDFHYIHERTLRDFTLGSYYYLAGLIDADGYLGKNTVEITLHSTEEFVLHKIKARYQGSVTKKSENCSRYRCLDIALRSQIDPDGAKNRIFLINDIYDKVLTLSKMPRYRSAIADRPRWGQLADFYKIKRVNCVNEQYFDY
jgi:hypothetical protein